MTYQTWVDLFGKAADDDDVRAALEAAGVTKPIKISSSALSAGTDLPKTGMHVDFTDASVLDPKTGRKGRPILSSVLMMLQHRKSPVYAGPLPYELEPATSRDAIRARFGAPVESEDELCWDIFAVDHLHLFVSYAQDLQSIQRVAVSLPGSR